MFLTPHSCAVELKSADNNINVNLLCVNVSCVCRCKQSTDICAAFWFLRVFKNRPLVFIFPQKAKDKSSLLMRLLMHAQEAILAMLYSTATDGRNVPLRLQWNLGLGCACELRVHFSLLAALVCTCCTMSTQNRSFRRSDCTDATVMTV